MTPGISTFPTEMKYINQSATLTEIKCIDMRTAAVHDPAK